MFQLGWQFAQMYLGGSSLHKGLVAKSREGDDAVRAEFDAAKARLAEAEGQLQSLTEEAEKLSVAATEANARVGRIAAQIAYAEQHRATLQFYLAQLDALLSSLALPPETLH